MTNRLKLKNKNISKKRKKLKIKYLIYITLIYISFSYSFYYTVKSNNSNSNEELIKYLLEGGTTNTISKNNLVSLVNNTMKYLLKVDITNPSTLLNLTIFSQNSSNSNENIILEHNDDYSNLEELKSISSYIEDPNKIDINSPVVYIYNSHQLENYNNANLEIYGITPNVLMASYIFKEKLNNLGVSTIVEDTNLSEFLTINNWNYSYSYKASRLLILDKKSKYSSLKYFIDIHRDSVTKDMTTTTIDNKTYAKILFVVGLEHSNYQENLKKAESLNNLISKSYPTLSRGILKKEGAGVDGIYNQDISNNSMLIEVGGVENNIEEVFNTIEALAQTISKFIGENNE